MKAVNDNIGIKRIDNKDEDKTESGIIIAKTEHETPEHHIGLVKVLPSIKAPGAEYIKKEVKVMYKHYRNIEYKGLEWIKFEDIICVDDNEDYYVE